MNDMTDEVKDIITEIVVGCIGVIASVIIKNK
jgi:hypothetical protein